MASNMPVHVWWWQKYVIGQSSGQFSSVVVVYCYGAIYIVLILFQTRRFWWTYATSTENFNSNHFPKDSDKCWSCGYSMFCTTATIWSVCLPSLTKHISQKGICLVSWGDRNNACTVKVKLVLSMGQRNTVVQQHGYKWMAICFVVWYCLYNWCSSLKGATLNTHMLFGVTEWEQKLSLMTEDASAVFSIRRDFIWQKKEKNILQQYNNTKRINLWYMRVFVEMHAPHWTHGSESRPIRKCSDDTATVACIRGFGHEGD